MQRPHFLRIREFQPIAQRWSILLLIVACVLGALAAVAVPAGAQGVPPVAALQGGRKTYPSQAYYFGLEVYRSGDLPAAVNSFENALSQTRRDQQGRWIDAIPVHAMLAECHFELGNLTLAHKHLDAACSIQLRFANWPSQLQWPPPQAAERNPGVNRIPWWSGPPMQETYVPSRMPLNEARQSIGVGPDGNAAVGAQVNALTIDAVEVLRGLAIVGYRRQVLMGSLGHGEPILENTIRSLGSAPPSGGPVATATLGSVEAILKLANEGKPQDANSSTAMAMVNGNQVHPISPLLLCAAARTVALGDQPQAAYPLALRAAAAASLLEQPEWVAEALQIAVGVKPDASAAELLNIATSAVAVFRNDARLLAARGGTVAIEAAIDAGRTGEASQWLTTVGGLLSNRNVQLPRSAATYHYAAARLQAAGGSRSAADQSIRQVIGFTSRNRNLESVPRLYQLRLLESAIRSASLGGQTTEKVIQGYLKPPNDAVWRLDPVEAIGSLAADRSAAMAAWIRSAASRNKAEEVLFRGDVQASQAFLQTLPLAGRVLQARWLAGATDDALMPEALEIRKQPPARLRQLLQAAGRPLPEELAAAAQAAQSQEAAAFALALERRDLPVAFPYPLRSKSQLEPLEQDEAILTFIPSGNALFAVLAKRDKVALWSVVAPARVFAQVPELLAGIGVKPNRAGSAKLPEDASKWRGTADQLRTKLIPDMTALDGIRRLAIVPTDRLWYLPFELLPVDGADSELLGERLDIGYAPTPGLAVQPPPPAAPGRPIGLLAFSLFAPQDRERNDEIAVGIEEAIEAPKLLPGPQPVPGRLIGTAVDHLIVAAPVEPSGLPTPYLWSPLLYDGDLAGSKLIDWLKMPWDAPRSVALPGFRSTASRSGANSGSDLFLTSMALHAAGSPHLILSRWAVGGESTGLLLKEYAQELAFIGPEAAWRRGLAVLRDSEIDPAGEVLLTSGDTKRIDLTGDEPLLWSSYMYFGSLRKAEQ